MSQPKVLLAEDDAQIGELVKAFMTKAGYDVTLVVDGEEAVKAAREVRPQVIVLDVMMPRMNGYQACAQIKKDPATRDIPVLFVTVKSSTKEKVEGLRLGAMDYVTKPFEPDELKARVEAALRIKELQDDLKARNEDLSKALAKANELAQAKEGLTHLLVHDLKAPLTGVLGTLDMLSAPEGPNPLSESQKKRLINLSLSSTRQVLRMVEEILEVQELEENRIKPHPEPIQVRALLELSAEKGRHLYPDRDIKVSAEVDERVDRVEADRGLLERVLDNLISNAVKFSKPNDHVKVIAVPGAGRVTFAIEDEGPGIPDSYKKRVFEKFVRIELGAHAARTGSGLGLALCKLAVEAHGGKIWIEDNQPRGSRFVFTLPAP